MPASSRALLVVALGLAPAAFAPGHALAAPPVEGLASHRAVYALDLARSRAQQVVAGVSGTMTFSMRAACDGWTVEQVYDTRMLYAEGPEIRWTTSYSTWESRDGREMTFTLLTTSNGITETELRGEATLDPETGGEARLRLPAEEVVPIEPGTMFPTLHTAALVEAIRRGETVFGATLFDGTDAAGAEFVSAVVGPEVTMPPRLDDPLLEGPSHRVRLAFFGHDPAGEIPTVEVGMRFFENGISDEVLLDYRDFGMRAVLVELEALPEPECH